MRLLREDAGFLPVSVSIASRYPRALRLVSRSHHCRVQAVSGRVPKKIPTFPCQPPPDLFSTTMTTTLEPRALLHNTQRRLWNNPRLHNPSVPFMTMEDPHNRPSAHTCP